MKICRLVDGALNIERKKNADKKQQSVIKRLYV